MVVRLAISGTSSAATAAARVMGATRRGAATPTTDAGARGLSPCTLQPNLLHGSAVFMVIAIVFSVCEVYDRDGRPNAGCVLQGMCCYTLLLRVGMLCCGRALAWAGPRCSNGLRGVQYCHAAPAPDSPTNTHRAINEVRSDTIYKTRVVSDRSFRSCFLRSSWVTNPKTRVPIG